MKLVEKTIEWLKSHQFAVSLGVFLLLVGAIYLPQRVRAYLQGPEAIHEMVSPRKKDLIQTVDVSGEVKAENQVTLKFQTSGKLAWIGVKKGDRVKKWQAIASLDKNQLKKSLEKEIYDYLNERWDFEQSHDDYDSSGLPLDKSILTDAAKRILEKAQFDLSRTVLDVEIAQETYSLATIYSPIEGIVIEADSSVAGVNITPATATFTVADPETMIFEIMVDEADISKVKKEQKVIINLDAYPDQEFEGKIARIDFASTSTSGGGTAFSAEITLSENKELRFKVGMNGDAEIIINQKENVLSLPLEAIREKNSHTFVEIIKNRKIEEIEIQTGLSTDTRIEIVSGLNENQKIIIGKKKKS